MMIEEMIIDAGIHARSMVNMPRLAQAPRAKFNRNEISTIVHDNLLLGRINVAEAILKAHRLNPYTTVDDLIGDIQVLLVKSNDELRASNPHYKVQFKVEDLIGES